jgi:predicted RNA polymerase sigma factor
VIHLLYTTGHTAPAGPELVRADLVERAIGLARMLRELMPDEREARGLLALLLLTDARRATRSAAGGRLLLLEEQDRSRWDRAAIAEGADLVTGALRGRKGHQGGSCCRRPSRRCTLRRRATPTRTGRSCCGSTTSCCARGPHPWSR